VDADGLVLLDVYAKPKEPVTDYRTRWSGLRLRDIEDAQSAECATKRIKDVIKVRSLHVDSTIYL